MWNNNKNILKFLLVISISIMSNLSLSDMAVIVHPDNASIINPDIIKKIFLGKKKKFTDGNVAMPVNALESLPSFDAFNATIISKSRTQINAYWARLVFTGKADMPKILPSDSAIISVVSANQGAIGYIDSSSVTDKVKVVANF